MPRCSPGCVRRLFAITVLLLLILGVRKLMFNHSLVLSSEEDENDNTDITEDIRSTTSVSSEIRPSVASDSESAISTHETHFAVSCLTEESRRNLPVLVKSVLFHACGTVIHLHVVMRGEQRVIQHLFDTWELQQVRLHFYHADESASDDNMLNALHTMMTDREGFYFTNHSKITELVIVPLHVVIATQLSQLLSTLRSESMHEDMLWFAERPLDTASNASESRLLYVTHRGLQSPNIHNTTMSQIDVRTTRGLFVPRVPGGAYHELVERMTSLDGDVFRHTATSGLHHNLNQSAPCREFTTITTSLRRTHLYFYTTPPSIRSLSEPISLITHLQMNRLSSINTLLSTWSGPAHIVVYLSDHEVETLLRFLCSSEVIAHKPHLAFHLVYRRRQSHYPINYMRNVAVREVITPYLLMLDVDFVPSHNLSLHALAVFNHSSKPMALVVPAFEALSADYEFPSDKKELLSQIENKKVTPYHSQSKWKLGHKYTNYRKWYASSATYPVKGWFGFEPYVIIPTKIAPLYPETLLERMRDKLPYTIELEASGVQMHVLPDVFAVHLPHSHSTSYIESSRRTFQRCRVTLYEEEVRRISTKYNKPRLLRHYIRRADAKFRS